MLRSLTGRIEQLLEGSRKGDWCPGEALPASQSGWVDALLSYLQVGCSCMSCSCVKVLWLLFAVCFVLAAAGWTHCCPTRR